MNTGIVGTSLQSGSPGGLQSVVKAAPATPTTAPVQSYNEFSNPAPVTATTSASAPPSSPYTWSAPLSNPPGASPSPIATPAQSAPAAPAPTPMNTGIVGTPLQSGSQGGLLGMAGSASPSPQANTGTVAQAAPTSESTPAASSSGGSNPGPGSAAPAPVGAFGATPSVSATLMDPNQNLQYMQSYEQNVRSALQPQFDQQNQQLQDQSAARGISSSGSAQYLQNNLDAQQAGVLASAQNPIIAQGYGYTNAALTGNANEANYVTNTNAAYYNQDRNANASAYNNYQNELLGLGSGVYGSQESAYLNSFGPNTGVTNSFGQALGAGANVFGNTLSSANQTAGANQTAAGTALANAFQNPATPATNNTYQYQQPMSSTDANALGTGIS